jgi:hypothetical protein
VCGTQFPATPLRPELTYENVVKKLVVAGKKGIFSIHQVKGTTVTVRDNLDRVVVTFDGATGVLKIALVDGVSNDIRVEIDLPDDIEVGTSPN